MRNGISGQLGHPLRGVSVHCVSDTILNEMQAANQTREAKVYEIEPTVIRPKGEGVQCPRDGKIGVSMPVPTIDTTDKLYRSGPLPSPTPKPSSASTKASSRPCPSTPEMATPVEEIDAELKAKGFKYDNYTGSKHEEEDFESAARFVPKL